MPDTPEPTEDDRRAFAAAAGLGAASEVIHSETATAEEKELAEKLAEGIARRFR